MIDEAFSAAEREVLEHYGLAVEHRWIEAPIVDGRAHVLVVGEGPPCVLLNGIGVPAAMLAPLVAKLKGVTTYAVDLPGCGLSDFHRRFTDNIRSNAVQFLTETIDGLGLDRPVVAANSLGSLFASWLAIDRPNRVSALAHIGCPAVVLDTSAPLPMRLLSARPLGRMMMKVQPPSDRQVLQLSKMVREHPLPPEIADLILATERLPHFEDAFLGMLHRLIRLRGSRSEVALTVEDLARIETPAILIFGRDDPMGGPEVGRSVADAMPVAELHIVDGGHAPWIHHADQIAPLLNGFVEGVGPADS